MRTLSSKKRKRGGQILVMVTLALFAMFGMLGLVVDLGWSYFLRKSAQSAADSAALAAVKRAYELTGGSSSPSAFTCGLGGLVACTDAGPIDCPGASGNLSAACLYAQQNGFTTSGRQHVTVEAGDIARSVSEPCGRDGATVNHPPTAGCVDTLYWVTVRVAEQTPQLFSAILGNTLGLVSARATAAVGKTGLPGALFLTGRGEPWNPDGAPADPGVNLWLSGGPNINVPPGINIASPADGSVQRDGYAGQISGTGDITSSMTNIRGNYDIQGSGTWNETPTPGMTDGAIFKDPYDGRGQPPIEDSVVLPMHGVLGGNLSAYCSSGLCGPGNYFATRMVGSTPEATGDPLIITGNVTFDGGPFGDFNFFGGLQIGAAQVTFGPGRYVIAGVKSQTTPLFNNDNNAMLVSSNPNGGDAGRIFILTDSNYPQLSRQVAAIQDQMRLAWPGPLVTVEGGRTLPTLYFSESSIKAGNNASSSVSLHGLNEVLASAMPTETNAAGKQLKDFALAPVAGQGAGVLIWQDQRNSYVSYNDHGEVVYDACTINNPCMNSTPAYPDQSPELEIWSSPYADLHGIIYQPRGAWTVVQANGDYTGAMRIVTGHIKFGGSGTLTLTGVGSPLYGYVTALVE